MITESALPPRRGAHVTDCGTLSATFVRKVELCRQWAKDVLDEIEGFDDVYGVNLDEVENRSRDGFIAFTDGGFNGVGLGSMSYGYGSGCAPQAIQPYIDSALKDIEKDWDERHPEHTVAWIYASEEEHPTLPGITPSREREHWREKFHEFEHESMSEGGTYFYKVRVLFYDTDNSSNESGEPEAFFMVGINTDFEYGRDTIPWLTCYGQSPHCTKWLWEKTVKIRDLNPRRIASLTRQAIKALGDA
jgi:hypothetical protein